MSVPIRPVSRPAGVADAEPPAAALSGEAAHLAWTTAWAEHHGGLVRYASHLLGGDVHAAEDVVQEAALRLWRHPRVLVDDQPVGGWLRTVVRHLVVDRARRRRARPTEVAMAPGADAPAPDDFDQVHAAAAVRSLLAGLSPAHRAVVIEIYVRDRPVSDVAADLGIPEGTVKSRCHHALRQLRDALPVVGLSSPSQPSGVSDRRGDAVTVKPR